MFLQNSGDFFEALSVVRPSALLHCLVCHSAAPFLLFILPLFPVPALQLLQELLPLELPRLLVLPLPLVLPS